MLTHKKLLIDKDCPLCNLYGNCFTKFKFVDNQTINYYQSIEEKYAQNIDMERAKNEIALYDIISKKSVYGLDALIDIIAHKNYWLKQVLQLPLIYHFLLYIYRFISYNRKVIYPSQEIASERNCIPDLNIKYRWLYILFVAGFTGWVLNTFTLNLMFSLGLEHNWYRELLICLGQVIWQGVAVSFIAPTKIHEYLGNMSSVSLMGGILLLPYLLLNAYLSMSIWIALSTFLLIVGFMFFEHIRRCKILGIPLIMTVSWVTFRLVVLVILIILNIV